MADGEGSRARPDIGRAGEPDHQAAAADWITIWQSELAALATDREMHESWVRLVTFWSQATAAAARLLPLRPTAASDEPAGHARAAPPPGSPAAMAAPDARDTAIHVLANRVDELERRLASLDVRRSRRRASLDPEPPA